MDLTIRVKEIKGKCPVYGEGDSFRLVDGYRLAAEGPVCMHALAALMPFYNALRICEPGELGLAGRENKDKAYIQCPDPADCTGGGTVIFEVARSS